MPRVKGAKVPTELLMLTELRKIGDKVDVSKLSNLVKFTSKYVVYLKLHWGYDLASHKTGRNVVSYELTAVPKNHSLLLECADAALAGTATAQHKVSYKTHGRPAGSPTTAPAVKTTAPKPKAAKPAKKAPAKKAKPAAKPAKTSNKKVAVEEKMPEPEFIDPDFDSHFGEVEDILKMVG